MELSEIVAELREDMTVAIGQLRAAFDEGPQRRAFRLALATLYTWRNTVRPAGVLYSDVEGGETLENLIELRGLYEHQLLEAKGQTGIGSVDLLPSPDLFPAEDRHMWEDIIRDDVDTSGWADTKGKKRAAYEALKGRVASDLLADAADFLSRQTS